MTRRMRAWLRSIPPTMVLPTRDAAGSCSSISSGDEALIDATQGVGTPFQDTFQSGDQYRQVVRRTGGVELLRVMGRGRDAKDAFACGIDLQGQRGAGQLEER